MPVGKREGVGVDPLPTTHRDFQDSGLAQPWVGDQTLQFLQGTASKTGKNPPIFVIVEGFLSISLEKGVIDIFFNDSKSKQICPKNCPKGHVW